MALLNIVRFPDPRLKMRSEEVTEFDDALKEFIRDLAATMYAAPGVGLAAVQVGVLKRLFIMDSRSEEEKIGLEVFINPEILEATGEIFFEEGCLSLPDFAEEIKRYVHIKVRFQDECGEVREKEIDDYRAVIFQHEFDHLNGVLATDRISRLKRTLYVRRRTRQLKQEESTHA